MKYSLLILWIILFTKTVWGSAVIFNGPDVKALKDNLKLKSGVTLMSGSADPTSSATDAEIGDLYMSTIGKLFKKMDSGSSTNWKELADEDAAINWIKNPTADVNTTGWATYDDGAVDVPVDGTGDDGGAGDNQLTFSRNTTTPLKGVGDFDIAKGASSCQGEGVSYDFSISKQDSTAPSVVKFYYETSANYTTGDMRVYVYDVDNAIMTEMVPRDVEARGPPTGYVGQFQTGITSACTGTCDYRLILHCTDTGVDTWDFNFDSVVVEKGTVVNGTPVTVWESFTPTGSWTTNTTYTGRKRRVGDTEEYNILVSVSGGAPTATTLFIDLENTIDTSKLPTTSSIDTTFGIANIRDSSGATYVNGRVRWSSSTQVAIVSMIRTTDANTGASVTNTVPFTFADGDSIFMKFSVPIQGWGSNQRSSSIDSGRDVYARAKGTSGSLTGTSGTLIFTTEDKDNTASYDTSTGKFTAPETSWYTVKGAAATGNATWSAGQFFGIVLDVDGTNVSRFLTKVQAGFTDSMLSSFSDSVYLTKGQELSLEWLSSVSVTISSSNDDNWISVEKSSGRSSQTLADEKVVVYAKDDSGQAVTSAITTFGTNTVEIDTHGAWNASTGTFTAPRAGYYSYTIEFGIASVAWSAADSYGYYAIKNGSNKNASFRRIDAAITTSQYYGASGMIYLLKGETLALKTYSARASTMLPTALYNTISIKSE